MFGIFFLLVSIIYKKFYMIIKIIYKEVLNIQEKN